MSGGVPPVVRRPSRGRILHSGRGDRGGRGRGVYYARKPLVNGETGRGNRDLNLRGRVAVWGRGQGRGRGLGARGRGKDPPMSQEPSLSMCTTAVAHGFSQPQPPPVLPRFPIPVPAYESEEDEEEDGVTDTARETSASNVFLAYHALIVQSANVEGDEEWTSSALSRTRELVDEGQKHCLVCIERIKIADAAWQCEQCYQLFHLLCIQSWIRKLVVPKEDTGRRDEAMWQCPKCRQGYSVAQAPTCYTCFCGKTKDPPFDPWLTGHSCGQTCGKPLKPTCGHTCTLLCHPGPCPPCPQMVQAVCFCGERTTSKRCTQRYFSCGGICRRPLPCGHSCPYPCHAAPCKPCSKTSVHLCRCKRHETMRKCSEMEWSCGEKCLRPYACGNHVCEKVCHADSCGECPLLGPRSCPCGKEVYELPCDIPTPTCGNTCEKLLDCGVHRCPRACHTGSCDKCRMVVPKKCRCGMGHKTLPCSEQFTCNSRCSLMRSCGRHQCKRRCCPGDCPPCQEVCGRKLSCGNHKCEAPCHAGPCLPCPVTVRVTCFCGHAFIEVPCGLEKGIKPPRCTKRCTIPPDCHHSQRSPHRCHFGPCPKCTQVCGIEYECGHTCPLPCHDPVVEHKDRPLNSRQRKRQQCLQEKGLLKEKKITFPPCPPCPIPVTRMCLGEHEERIVKCSDPSFLCERPCGNLLHCGNHSCSLACHVITIRRSRDDFDLEEAEPNEVQPDDETYNEDEWEWVEDSCEICQRSCTKERPPYCRHTCEIGVCHPYACPTCTKTVVRACYCGHNHVRFPCFNLGDKETLAKLLSCGNPCFKKLPFCNHTCPVICHPGECPEPENCGRKVKVHCPCGRIKKEWICSEVQKAQRAHGDMSCFALLSCDPACEEKRRKEEEQRLRPVSRTEPGTPKNRKQRQVVESPTRPRPHRTGLFSLWNVVFVVSLVVGCLAAIWGIYSLYTVK